MKDDIIMNFNTLNATLSVAENLAYQLEIDETNKTQIEELQGVISSLVIVADKVNWYINKWEKTNN